MSRELLPDCEHFRCPGYWVDDMFNDRVRCGCPCHLETLPPGVHGSARREGVVALAAQLALCALAVALAAVAWGGSVIGSISR